MIVNTIVSFVLVLLCALINIIRHIELYENIVGYVSFPILLFLTPIGSLVVLLSILYEVIREIVS